jgi:molybdate transport repressor ModE-like protein
MDLGEIETLAAVSRTGSISAAAKAAGVSVSTAARRLDALEARLKLRLVDRRANGARLTADGVRLAALAEPLSAQLASISRAAEALRHGETTTLVRVSATEAIIADILAPALPSLWSSAPGIQVQLQSLGGNISPASRDADIAIRMVRPSGAALIIRKLPDLHIGLFASRHWLAGRTPDEVDLEAGPLLTYDDSFGRIPELAWLESLGLAGAVRLRTGSTRALLTATLAGAGIGLLPRLFIRPGSGLVEIPTDTPPPVRTPWLAVHRDLRRHAPIAATHRWIIAAFTAALAQQLGRHV